MQGTIHSRQVFCLIFVLQKHSSGIQCYRNTCKGCIAFRQSDVKLRKNKEKYLKCKKGERYIILMPVRFRCYCLCLKLALIIWVILKDIEGIFGEDSSKQIGNLTE